MGTLKRLLTSIETSDRSWQDGLKDIQLALNCTLNRVTESSPLELLIGKVARPLNLLCVDDAENVVDTEKLREQAVQNMEQSGNYEEKNALIIIRQNC